MYAFIEIPYKLRLIVERELYENETIKWCRQPRVFRLVLKSLPVFLFSIPFTAFAVFWMHGASGAGDMEEPGAWRFFYLFGLPFLLVGLTMLLSPVWAAIKAKRTVYVITNTRAIIFEKDFSVKVSSFGADKLNDITKRVRSDGSGDIILDRRVKYDREGDDRVKEIGFFGIPRVNEVEDMLKEIA